MKYLNQEEKDLIESYNRDEWKSIGKQAQKKYIRAAKESLAKIKKHKEKK